MKTEWSFYLSNLGVEEAKDRIEISALRGWQRGLWILGPKPY